MEENRKMTESILMVGSLCSLVSSSKPSQLVKDRDRKLAERGIFTPEQVLDINQSSLISFV